MTRKWWKKADSNDWEDPVQPEDQEWTSGGDEDVEWYPQEEGEYHPMQEEEAPNETEEMWEPGYGGKLGGAPAKPRTPRGDG